MGIDGTCSVRFYKLINEAANKRWTDTTLQHAADWRQKQVAKATAVEEAAAAGDAGGCGGNGEGGEPLARLEEEERVSALTVVASASIDCTPYQVKKAALHAKVHFPGAPVPAKPRFERVQLGGVRAAAVAAFIVATAGGAELCRR